MIFGIGPQEIAALWALERVAFPESREKRKFVIFGGKK